MKNVKLILIGVLSFALMSFGLKESKLLQTSLKITVINELGNTEEGVTVTLYKTDEDYKKETNPVMTDSTDRKGRVSFKDLEAIEYFVSAVKGKKNNYGAGIKTNPLVEGKMNKVNIVIE